MHYEKCYHLCNRYHGRVVRIHDIDGNVHVGRITDVTDDSVWIQSADHRNRRFNTGYGYSGYDDYDEYDRYDGYYGYDGYDDGYDGYGYDGYYGTGAVELAFGFIVGIALASLFFF